MRQWLLACAIMGIFISLCHHSSLLEQLWLIAHVHPYPVTWVGLQVRYVPLYSLLIAHIIALQLLLAEGCGIGLNDGGIDAFSRWSCACWSKSAGRNAWYSSTANGSQIIVPRSIPVHLNYVAALPLRFITANEACKYSGMQLPILKNFKDT